MTTQLPFNLEDLQFDLDLNNIEFEIDAIQNEILQFYIQTDLRFRRAFYTNFTPQFFRMLRDKSKLKQPVTLSCSGNTRGGKSSSMITIGIIHSALYNKLFTVDYICGNSMEYLEKLRDLPEEMTRNSMFIIDEAKSLFSIGSFARKTRFIDVQNITAKYNVSNISICPSRVANPDSNYSLRVFGKSIYKNKPYLPDGTPNYTNPQICRFMLYNLQGGDRTNGHPLGMVYIPNFTSIFPKPYVDELNDAYIKKKDLWIAGELQDDSDVLSEMRLKIAKNFFHDDKLIGLKKKERLSLIILRLGSAYSKTEAEDICNLTYLLEKGVIPDD